MKISNVIGSENLNEIKWPLLGNILDTVSGFANLLSNIDSRSQTPMLLKQQMN